MEKTVGVKNTYMVTAYFDTNSFTKGTKSSAYNNSSAVARPYEAEWPAALCAKKRSRLPPSFHAAPPESVPIVHPMIPGCLVPTTWRDRTFAVTNYGRSSICDGLNRQIISYQIPDTVQSTFSIFDVARTLFSVFFSKMHGECALGSEP